MKRYVFGLAALTLSLSLAWMGVASAQDIRSGTSPSISAAETIDGSVYIAGTTVTVEGTINGDVYCAGQTVTITAHVMGDVICGAQTIVVGGKVDGSLRLAGQTVTLNGQAGRSASIAAQTLHVGQGAVITSDLTGAAQTLTLAGKVGRDLALAVQTADISGQIGRDVSSNGEHITLTQSAKIGGDLTYTSSNEASLDGAVAGTISRHEPPKHDTPKTSAADFMNVARFVTLMFVILTSLTLVLLWPRVFSRLTSHAFAHGGKTFLIGLVANLVAFPLIALLAATFIGLPLAFLLLLGWLIVAMVSVPLGAYTLGKLVWRAQTNQILVMLTGLLLLGLAMLLPFIGLILWPLIQIFGTGMAIHEASAHYERPHFGGKTD